MAGKHAGDVFAKLVCQVYSMILLACGLYAFAEANYEAKARSSIMAGATTAASIALCARLLGRPVRSPDASSRKIGFYLALGLSSVYAGVFAWRGLLALQAPGKEWLANVLFVMTAASVLASALLVYSRIAGAEPKAAGKKNAVKVTTFAK